MTSTFLRRKETLMFFPTMKGLPLHRVMMRTVTEFVDDEM